MKLYELLERLREPGRHNLLWDMFFRAETLLQLLLDIIDYILSQVVCAFTRDLSLITKGASNF